jgi:glycerophosphoryl diester phosphodiesterase
MTLPDAFLTAPLAHRGFHDRARGIPENSRAAFQAAIDVGYGIELDVQLSADDQAMVFHDYELSRLTGETGAVRQRTAAELGAIPLTGGDDGIPTLAEVLDLVAGQVPLLVEIKDQDGALMQNTGPLQGIVADALRSYAGPVAVMSFNPFAMQDFASVAPDIPRGLTTDAFTSEDWSLLPEKAFANVRDIPMYDTIGASFISHDARDLTRPRVLELKQQGAHILCWTIRSREQEDQARNIAENITFEGYSPKISVA